MEIYHHANFLKNYRKRITSNKSLDSQYRKRLKMFLIDSKNPLLKDHKLKGRKSEYRAFSVTGDIRVLYKIIDENRVILYDIGTHNQVY